MAKGKKGKFTKQVIDPKYARAYDHLSLSEVVALGCKLRRDIAQEGWAAQGGGLRAEVARANRQELYAQLRAVEERMTFLGSKL